MYKDKLKYGFCLGLMIVLSALSLLIKNEMYGNLFAFFSIIIGSITFHQLRTKNFKNYE